MDLKNYKNIVIIGTWNMAIFTPNWVNNYLIDGDENGEIPIDINFYGNRIISKIYNLGNYKIHISDEALALIANNTEPETYELLLDKAKSILSFFPHTIVTSIGINFYIFDEIQKALPSMDIEDVNLITKVDRYTFFSKKRTGEDLKPIIQVQVENHTDKQLYNFNYSFNLKNISEAKEVLSTGTFVKFRSESENIITAIQEI